MEDGAPRLCNLGALINTALQRGDKGQRNHRNRFNGFPLARPDVGLYSSPMSLHSYSRVWLHLVWSTLERRPFFRGAAAAKVSEDLYRYAEEKRIYMKINYVNPEHVHALVDLPTGLAIEEMMQLFKGASSRRINESNLLPGKFGWGRGYGVFSVSHSGMGEVAKYIAQQEEHHRKRDFSEELKILVERYGLKWLDDKTAKAVL